jgi:hypothetical protein
MCDAPAKRISPAAAVKIRRLVECSWVPYGIVSAGLRDFVADVADNALPEHMWSGAVITACRRGFSRRGRGGGGGSGGGGGGGVVPTTVMMTTTTTTCDAYGAELLSPLPPGVRMPLFRENDDVTALLSELRHCGWFSAGSVAEGLTDEVTQHLLGCHQERTACAGVRAFVAEVVTQRLQPDQWGSVIMACARSCAAMVVERDVDAVRDGGGGGSVGTRRGRSRSRSRGRKRSHHDERRHRKKKKKKRAPR